jgi:alpha-beta hydrolase superfamily lysophospholipase
MTASVNEVRFELTAEDGSAIACYRWGGEAPARGVLQLAHGMGEHAQRYREPLAPLTEQGIVIYANDHRGHGATALDRAALGDFGPQGFSALVDDMTQLTMKIMEREPGVPIVLMGHSMGSFAAQLYALDNNALIDGLVLSGSAALDLLVAAMMNSGSAGLEAFNAAFEPARTPFDWLSRDPAEVDKYIADPLCGFSAQPTSALSMFGCAERMADPTALRGIRPDLPIYVFAGDTDPVNGGLALLQPLVERYRAAGIVNIATDYYPAGRHEMLNETNREEVVGKLATWLLSVFQDASRK